MNCTNCGNIVPEGVPSCPLCGAQAPINTYQQPDDMYQQPYQIQMTPAPKKGVSAAIIIGAVVAIAAIVVVLVLFVFGGKVDGTYVWDDWAMMGIKMELEIDEDEFTLTSYVSYDGVNFEVEEVVEGDVKVKGKEVTLTYEGEDDVLEFDKKEETLTMEESGMTIIFEKK